MQNILQDPSFMQQIQQVSQSLQRNEMMQQSEVANRQKLLQQQEEFDQQIQQQVSNLLACM